MRAAAFVAGVALAALLALLPYLLALRDVAETISSL